MIIEGLKVTEFGWHFFTLVTTNIKSNTGPTVLLSTVTTVIKQIIYRIRLSI